MAFAQPNYLIGANALNAPLVYQLKEVPKYCSLYIEDASHIRLDIFPIRMSGLLAMCKNKSGKTLKKRMYPF